MTALTADLVARAIIAAARVYGDCPVKALMVLRGLPRRCLTPAAAGISAATGASLAQAARVLNIRKQNFSRSAASAHYREATLAAERAARFAAWRPEARESVIRPYATGGVLRPEGAPAPVGEHALSAAPGRIRMLTPKAVQREVAAALAAGVGQTAVQIAADLKLGEGAVRQALLNLRQAGGAVRAEVVGAHWREQLWRAPATATPAGEA